MAKGMEGRPVSGNSLNILVAKLKIINVYDHNLAKGYYKFGKKFKTQCGVHLDSVKFLSQSLLLINIPLKMLKYVYLLDVLTI